MAAALREVARREPLAGRPFDARLLAELRGGIERHALVAAERDRLRYRAAPMPSTPLDQAPLARARRAPGAPRAASRARGACGARVAARRVAGDEPARAPRGAARRAARAAQRRPRGGSTTQLVRRPARARGPGRAVRGLGRARAPRARRRSSTAARTAARCDVAFVVPGFRRGSGGHTTIANLVRGLEARGHTCSIWIDDPLGRPAAPSAFRAFFGPFDAPGPRRPDALRTAPTSRSRPAGRPSRPCCCSTAAARASTSSRTTSPSSIPPPPSGCGPSGLPAADDHRRHVAGRADARARACRATPFDLGIDHATYRPRPQLARRAAPRPLLRPHRHAAPRRSARPARARRAARAAARRPRSSCSATPRRSPRRSRSRTSASSTRTQVAARVRARPRSASSSASPTTRWPRRRWRRAACPPSSCARRAPRPRSATRRSSSRPATVLGPRRRDRAPARERGDREHAGIEWARSRTWDAAAAAVERGLREARGVSARPAPLAILLAVATIQFLAWVLVLPALQPPDEHTHFAYTQRLLETGHRPPLERRSSRATRPSWRPRGPPPGLQPLIGNLSGRPYWTELDERLWRQHDARSARTPATPRPARPAPRATRRSTTPTPGIALRRGVERLVLRPPVRDAADEPAAVPADDRA